METLNAKQKNKKSNRVTLDVELQDILDIVSKSNNKILENQVTFQTIESEELRKAWFKHMLISLEKLNDLIETIRNVELVNIRSEFREETKRLEEKLEKKLEKSEDELKVYKKDVIDPMNTKVTTLIVKVGIWSALVSLLTSGIITATAPEIFKFITKCIG